jgi:flagellar P-ring protein precursor FlgI
VAFELAEDFLMNRAPWQMWIAALVSLVAAAAAGAVEGVRLKDLGRIDGVRDNMVVGYGLVTGLAGTGDSSRSQATLQSIVNALQSFGVNVTMSQLSTRNVAGVMVVATLPAYARPGDKLDVNVSSVGDARSLSGGTLLMMPLYGPDKSVYALAQGPLAVGGYKYELNGNSVQRNHPTAGTISEGATVEKNVAARIIKDENRIDVLLSDPDYTTASRVAEAVNANFQNQVARAVDAGRVAVNIPTSDRDRIVDFVARVENTIVQPDQRARVVVNERTGTVVSGGDVRISAVTVAHGNLRVSIVTDYLVSQPNGVYANPGSQISTQVVPQTRVDANEENVNVVSLPPDTRVAELVEALNKIKTNTRDVIAVLQSIKAAGALHAELILQ